MFGISIESNNNDKNNDEVFKEKVSSLYEELKTNPSGFKISFVFGFFLFFFLAFGLLSLILFGIFYLSAFAWNNSFVHIFDLPVMSWLNMAFGYIFVYIVYRMLRTMW